MSTNYPFGRFQSAPYTSSSDAFPKKDRIASDSELQKMKKGWTWDRWDWDRSTTWLLQDNFCQLFDLPGPQSSNPKIGMAARYNCPKSSERLSGYESTNLLLLSDSPQKSGVRESNTTPPWKSQVTMVLWHFKKSRQSRLDPFFGTAPHSAWLPVEAGEIDTNQDHSAALPAMTTLAPKALKFPTNSHWTSDDSPTRIPRKL